MAFRLSDPHHPLLRHIHQLLHAYDVFPTELDDVSTATVSQTHRSTAHRLSWLIVCLLQRTVRCGPAGWWWHTVGHACPQLVSRRTTFTATWRSLHCYRVTVDGRTALRQLLCCHHAAVLLLSVYPLNISVSICRPSAM
jgi:hypothetical protein